MLLLLAAGVGMGAGGAVVPPDPGAYVMQIGIKHGVVRLDAPDINAPTGMSGVA